METYESAFGPNAADVFGKAIRAWHAVVRPLGFQTEPRARELRTRYVCVGRWRWSASQSAFFHDESGSYSSMARASLSVCSPRSF